MAKFDAKMLAKVTMAVFATTTLREVIQIASLKAATASTVLSIICHSHRQRGILTEGKGSVQLIKIACFYIKILSVLRATDLN